MNEGKFHSSWARGEAACLGCTSNMRCCGTWPGRDLQGLACAGFREVGERGVTEQVEVGEVEVMRWCRRRGLHQICGERE